MTSYAMSEVPPFSETGSRSSVFTEERCVPTTREGGFGPEAQCSRKKDVCRPQGRRP